MSQITYEDKERFAENLSIPEKNKVTAANMNMIKNSVNALYTGESGLVIPLRITLTEAEIDVLNSSPYLAIPAPGVGKMLVPNLIYVDFIAGNTIYQNGMTNDLFYEVNGVSIAVISLDSASSFNRIRTLFSGENALVSSLRENEPFYFSSDADFMQGDGVVNIIIYYSIENTF